MPYFSKIGQTLSFKNNLVRQIFEVLKSNNRKIIADENLKQFEVDILKQIKMAHEMNPRCKPVKCAFEDDYDKNGDRRFTGYYGINFYIYKAK